MINPIITVLLWSCVISLLSIFEIETHGRYDWTERNPSWSRSFPIVHLLHTMLRTGVSTLAHLMQILAFHVQFLLGALWTPATELQALSTYFIVLPLYDVVWFVLRPRTEEFAEVDTWKRSKAPSLRGVPLHLLLSVPVATSLTWIASQIVRNDQIMTDFAVSLLGFVAYLMFMIMVAPVYRAWHGYVASTPATNTSTALPKPQQATAPKLENHPKSHSGLMNKFAIVAGMSCVANGLLLACSEQHPSQRPWLSGNPNTYFLSGIFIILTVIAHDRSWKKQLV